MWTKLWKEIAEARAFPGAPPEERVTAAELAELPPSVIAYLAFYEVTVGQPKHWSLRLGWRGRFRSGPNASWMPIEAVQYDLRAPVTRVFHMRGRMKSLVPVLARDTYVDGRGHLVAKIADLLTVADARGRAFDEGELVTWLNDCVLYAPTMLLGPSTRWSQVDARSFDVAFTDGDVTVHAHVRLDERGAPVDFETTDRFLYDPHDSKRPLIRARWSTPIGGWQRIGRWRLPTRGRATWHLARGEYTYAEIVLDPASVAFDVPPQEEAAAA